MSALLDENGAQVLPPAEDPRARVTAYAAYACLSADLRARSKPHAALAARLEVAA